MNDIYTIDSSSERLLWHCSLPFKNVSVVLNVTRPLVNVVSLCWPTLTSAQSVLHNHICHIPVYSWAPCNKCDAVSREAPVCRRHAGNASHAESYSRFNLFNFHRLNWKAARMSGISNILNIASQLYFAFFVGLVCKRSSVNTHKALLYIKHLLTPQKRWS